MKIPIARARDIPEGESRMFQVGEHHVVVCNVGGTFHAIGNICPHRGAFLGQGVLKKNVITCPWHNWQFDVTTGHGITNPHAHLPRYSVHLNDDMVLLEL